MHILKKFRERYPRLPVRIIADSLYPSEALIKLCEEVLLEYIFVLRDKKIPTILEEFLEIVSMPEGNRMIIEQKEKWILIMWANEIDYKGNKVSVIRQITKIKYNKKSYNRVKRRLAKKDCSFKLKWIPRGNNKIAHKYSYLSFSKT